MRQNGVFACEVIKENPLGFAMSIWFIQAPHKRGSNFTNLLTQTSSSKLFWESQKGFFCFYPAP